jgi:hypothetical protein
MAERWNHEHRREGSHGKGGDEMTAEQETELREIAHRLVGALGTAENMSVNAGLLEMRECVDELWELLGGYEPTERQLERMNAQ